MELRAGLRLESATCDAQLVVVKAPKDVADVDVRCGGAPLRPLGEGGEQLSISVEGDPVLLGKRYEDPDLGLELLCTQGGAGTLTIGDRPLLVKGAKPLPSSD